MHVMRQRRRRPRRARPRLHRQPDVPRHRPPHLQRLHEGVRLPEAGAGEHPADRDARAHRDARACRGGSRSTASSRGGTRSTSSARTTRPYNGQERPRRRPRARPATRSSHHLACEGFGGRRGRRAQDRAARPRASSGRDGERAGAGAATSARLYGELDERILLGFGGVSEYGITVRWDKNFLTLVYLTLSRQQAPHDLRRHPLRRDDDARGRLGARLRPRRDRRGGGAADDHRHEEQPVARHPQGERLPDGPAADRCLQEELDREPAGDASRRSSSAAGSRRSTRRRSCSRTTSCRSRRPQERFDDVRARDGRRASVRAMFDDEEWELLEEQLAHAQRARRRSGRSRAKEGREPHVQALLAQVGRRDARLPQVARTTRPRTA